MHALFYAKSALPSEVVSGPGEEGDSDLDGPIPPGAGLADKPEGP